MRRVACSIWWFLCACLMLAGCNQNPYGAQSAGLPPQQQKYLAGVQQLEQRAQQLDTNNSDLHTQLADSQRQNQVLDEQIVLLQKQLADSATQLRTSQLANREMELTMKRVELAKSEADERSQTLQASMRRRGGASITANNSLQQTLPTVSAPGVSIRRDGDVVRIEIPADQLFPRGGSQLLPSAATVLDQVANIIAVQYPKQIVVIEGHTSSEPLLDKRFVTQHALSAAQATTVFEQLSQRNRLPANQLRIMGQGAAHPLVSNATTAGLAKNRRLELVVYPDQFSN